MGMFKQSLIFILIISILALNVAAEKTSLLDKIRKFEGKQIKPDDTCSSRCIASKNSCSSKCREFAYVVCRNNCMRQSSKCVQDCRTNSLLESKFKQSRKIQNLFLKFKSF